MFRRISKILLKYTSPQAPTLKIFFLVKSLRSHNICVFYHTSIYFITINYDCRGTLLLRISVESLVFLEETGTLSSLCRVFTHRVKTSFEYAESDAAG